MNTTAHFKTHQINSPPEKEVISITEMISSQFAKSVCAKKIFSYINYAD